MPVLTDDSVTLTLAGETMVLLGGRAMFWPARRRLVIADLHLGKEHVFRQAGIAVPRGATDDDLQRLGDLLDVTGAQSLWIVGDVLHGPASGASWRDSWRQWRQKYRHIEVAALIGNHDRALDADALFIHPLGDICSDGPFVFRHIPQADKQGRYGVAGHIHPQARVPGVPRNWPVFWIRPEMIVLPAFSAFTGGQHVSLARGDRLVACVEGSAIPI